MRRTAFLSSWRSVGERPGGGKAAGAFDFGVRSGVFCDLYYTEKKPDITVRLSLYLCCKGISV